MERIHLEFDFSEKEIADSLFGSKPPKNVSVDKPVTIVKASAVSGGVYVQLAIDILTDIKEVGIAVIGAWIFESFIKSGKKKGRVNRKHITYTKRNIQMLIRRELAEQKARDAQYKKSKKKKR